jgi:dGTPase
MSVIKELRESRHLGIKGKRDNDLRSAYEMDYARLIHSSAFRRLQGKSQVFTAGTGDYYRTRLTHSLEVAQIARHAAQSLEIKYREFFTDKNHPALQINPRVIECASLAHDFGHPPFGHKGEHVLNEIIKQNIIEDNDFYFEGNPQNFRILMHLEKKSDYDGLNLTNAVLLSINKYPILGSRDNMKGLYKKEWNYIDSVRGQWDLPPKKSTLEAQLMDICDDIAYSTHDIEDGIKAGKIGAKSLLSDETIDGIIQELDPDHYLWADKNIDIKTYVTVLLTRYGQKWDDEFEKCHKEQSRTRREVKGYWVNHFVTNLGIIQDGNWHNVTFINDDGRENLDIAREMVILKKLAWTKLINDFRVQRLQKRSERILHGLWDAFIDPKKGKALLPKDWVKRQEAIKERWDWREMVLDYIAGMTDAYAIKVYADLYGYGASGGSIYGVD